jgi:hypothetical protein
MASRCVVTAQEEEEQMSSARFASLALGVVLTSLGLLGGSVQTAAAQIITVPPSDPGGVAVNGDFFVFKQLGSSLRVYKWTQDTWTFLNEFLTMATSPPSTRGPIDGFFFAAYAGSSSNVRKWALGGSQTFSNIGGGSISAPSEVMYQNRVFVVDQNGDLYEQFVQWSSAQSLHGKPSSNTGVSLAKPTVLQDGSVFVTAKTGELFQRWWDSPKSKWAWHNHHYCEEAILPWNRKLALWTGAAMPNKIFVTCNDGTLRQVYHSQNNWEWYNHGTGGYYVSGPPVAFGDGKLFVTALWGTQRILLQLYWANSMWLWYNHGTPPGTSISGYVAAAYGGDRAVVRGLDGNYYARFWNSSTSQWEWKNCGHP